MMRESPGQTELLAGGYNGAMSEGHETSNLGPIGLERFLACLLNSQLVDTRMLLDAIDGVQLRQYPQDGVDRLCEYLITRDILTQWQCEKLREGRHKGFIMGEFKLVDCLDRVSSTEPGRYLAEECSTGRVVTILIAPGCPGGTIE